VERRQAEGAGPQAAAGAGHHMELLRVGSRHQVGVALLHTLRMLLLQRGLHTPRPRVGVLLQGMPPRVVVHHTGGVAHPRVEEHLRGTQTAMPSAQ
jgi:hypothetical protein